MQRGVERRTRAARLAVAACLLLSVGTACSYLWRGTGRAAASVAAQEVDVLGASERGGPRLQSAAAAPPEDTQPQLYTYRVVHAYPHDRGSFTQGLVYAGADRFYESSGQYGESSVRLVELATGAVVKRTNVDASLFAEGLVLSYDNTTLLQLTWRSGKGISYDAQSLRRLSDFNTGLQDGWGITNGALPSEYLATDGTHRLYTLDAQSLQSTRSVEVRDGSHPVRLLNELELIRGEVWANIWTTDCIARINPASGRVTAWMLLHGLRDSVGASERSGSEDVLNGIAWDAIGKRLFLTGKYWPRLFEVKLVRVKKGGLSLMEARQKCIR